MADRQNDRQDRESEPSSSMSEGDRQSVGERSSGSAKIVHEVVRLQGDEELDRPILFLLFSGFAAGVAICASLLAEAFLRAHLPKSEWTEIFVPLGYTVGFVIVILGKLQLLTESTVTAVLPVATHPTGRNLGRLLRLWAVVFVSALFVLIALVAGTFNALEAGTNSALRKGLDAPFLSLALISVTTLTASLVAALALGERWPGGGQISAIPWWGWTGGLLGFGFVTAMIYTAESLGAALFIGLTVTASTTASVALDHFGLLGFAQHSAGTGRIIGALFMTAGVALFAIF